MDENQLELADGLAEAQRKHGIQLAQLKMSRQSDPDFDGVSCLECGDDLPAVRLQHGRIRCTRCESILEARAKLHGR